MVFQGQDTRSERASQKAFMFHYGQIMCETAQARYAVTGGRAVQWVHC